MTNPSRSQLITTYWLNNLSFSETAELYGLSYQRLERRFKRLGILRRTRNGPKVDRLRLELMLWPSVVEYERERCKRLAKSPG